LPSFTKFNSFVEVAMEGGHNLGSNVLKILLTNTAPVASNTVKADLTEITAQNGYSAGGATVTITASSQTSGTYKLVGDDVVFTASGGSFGPWRYAVLYNDTHASKALIAWWDYGSSVTTLTTETATVDFDGTNGILQVV
jgi:hypothetical protein